MVKVTYFAHACFSITADNGVTFLLDPYKPEGLSKVFIYGRLAIPAVTSDDIKPAVITNSHDHHDHSYQDLSFAGIDRYVKPGNFVISGINFRGIMTSHGIGKSEDGKGSPVDRGGNTAFVFDVDGVRICHLGDLGRKLTKEEVAAIGKIDVLMIPVGGPVKAGVQQHYTLGAEEAVEIIKQLKPKVVIPMHFNIQHLAFPLDSLDDFSNLFDCNCVKRIAGGEFTFTKDTLPTSGSTPTILILEPKKASLE